ncbi:flagella basal body P-ring formation protein FlgA, partial [Vibrio parahaemolyticus]
TFRRPGITLSLQGRATEPGAMGETVRVMNLSSNKIVQAIVIGPGEVEVLAATGTPVAQGLAARTAAVN